MKENKQEQREKMILVFKREFCILLCCHLTNKKQLVENGKTNSTTLHSIKPTKYPIKFYSFLAKTILANM